MTERKNKPKPKTAKAKEVKLPGRPSKFTDAIAKEICRRISEGELLTMVCRSAEMPTRSTVYLWLSDPKHKEFSDAYTHAVKMQTEAWADEMIEDALDSMDGVNTQSKKLLIDTKKWIMARKHPKQWGDKIDVTSDGEKMNSTVQLFLPDNGRGDFDDKPLDK